MRDSWEETVTKMVGAGVGKRNTQLRPMMLPGEWIEDAPCVGVHIQPTSWASALIVLVEE